MADHDHPAGSWSRSPTYRPGGRLSAEQLNAGQDDALRRDRIVNVAMHGVGVVFGYRVATDAQGHVAIRNGCIHVTCGLAIDLYGRMLFWRGGAVSIRDIVGCKPRGAGPYMLTVHYAEHSDSGDAYDPNCNPADWIHRCVVFSLKQGCAPWDGCAPDIPADACMTRREWICARSGFAPGVVPEDADLASACVDLPPLCSTDCGRFAYDPDAGLPLSCLEICDLDRDKHDCDPRFGFCPCTPIDNCSVRPVAYRNRLLYELINLDDVPRAKIRSYSWSHWRMTCWSNEYRVPFDAFRRRARACRDPDGCDPREGFSLMFDRPVERCSLHPLSVLMEIWLREQRPHYWRPARIPIDVLHLDADGRILPEDSDETCAWGVLLCPLEDWVRYELDDTNSTILDCANRNQLARIEITLRGQIIRDCCGLMIDVRPPDVDRGDPCHDRSGQARVGGDWLDVFRVGPNTGPGHGYDDDCGCDDDDHDDGYDDKGRRDYDLGPDDPSGQSDPYAGDRDGSEDQRRYDAQGWTSRRSAPGPWPRRQTLRQPVQGDIRQRKE